MKHRRIRISARGKVIYTPRIELQLSNRMRRIKAIQDAKKLLTLYDQLVAARKLNVCF